MHSAILYSVLPFSFLSFFFFFKAVCGFLSGANSLKISTLGDKMLPVLIISRQSLTEAWF